VVPFRRRRPPGAHRTARRGAATAENPLAWLDRVPVGDDAALNDEWDRLLSAVIQAWSWRDPDSVAKVKESIAQLRWSVDRDWS
jgi:hypothetical protein